MAPAHWLGLVALLQACQATQTMLFVGNSLTFVNNLDQARVTPCNRLTNLTQAVQMLSKLAANTTYPFFTARSVRGGATFRDHALAPDLYAAGQDLRTIETIRSQRWNFVSLQDQSMSWFLLGPQYLDEYGSPINYANGHFSGNYDVYPLRLAEESRKKGATPVYFATWARNPSNNSISTLEEALEIESNYSFVASRDYSMLAPAGRAMAYAYEDYGGRLYTDDVHPSVMGTYLAACVFYYTLTGISPLGLHAADTNIAQADLTKLQQHAVKAFVDARAAWRSPCLKYSCVRFMAGAGALPALVTTGVGSTPAPFVTASVTTTETVTWVEPPTFEACAKLVQESFPQILPNSSILSTVQNIRLSTRLLESDCTRNWTQCYSLATHSPDAHTFHHECDFRGPTLVVARVGDHNTAQDHDGRIFGGISLYGFYSYVPDSWTSSNTAVKSPGAWLYRFDPTTASLLDWFYIQSSDGVTHYDYGTSCPFLGKWTEIMLPTCDHGFSSGSASVDYPSTPTGFDDKWFAGADTFRLDAFEVYYSPDFEHSTRPTRRPTPAPFTSFNNATTSTTAPRTATSTQPSTTGRAPSTTVTAPVTTTTKTVSTPKATRGQAFTTTRSGQQPPRTSSQDDVTESSNANASSGQSQSGTIEVIIFVVAGTLVLLVILVLVARRSKRQPRSTFSNGPNAFVNPTYAMQPSQAELASPDLLATGSVILMPTSASPFDVAPARGPISPFDVTPARAADPQAPFDAAPGQPTDQIPVDAQPMRDRKTTVWAKPAGSEPAGDQSEL